MLFWFWNIRITNPDLRACKCQGIFMFTCQRVEIWWPPYQSLTGMNTLVNSIKPSFLYRKNSYTFYIYIYLLLTSEYPSLGPRRLNHMLYILHTDVWIFGYSDSLPSHIAFDKLLVPLLLSSPLSKWVCLKTAAPYLGIQWA